MPGQEDIECEPQSGQLSVSSKPHLHTGGSRVQGHQVYASKPCSRSTATAGWPSTGKTCTCRRSYYDM